jgi:hypothetical protein
MVRSRRAFNFPQIGIIELLIATAIIAMIAAIAIPVTLSGRHADWEGKKVTVDGFNEVGIVTDVEFRKATVYFPKTGESTFKVDMLREVESDGN